MTQQPQDENPGGIEGPLGLFDKFAIGVEKDGKREVAFTSLAEILNCLRPANATIGHALGILLQFCGEPLEQEAIRHAIQLLESALQAETVEPPDTQDDGPQLRPDEQALVNALGKGLWVTQNQHPDKQTHTEVAIIWQPAGVVVADWSRHTDCDLPKCVKTFSGMPAWAELHAEKARDRLNSQGATPADLGHECRCEYLTRKTYLMEHIHWENVSNAGNSAGGCAQPDLAVVPRPEAGGGAEAPHSGDYLVHDPIGDDVLAIADAGGRGI